MRQIIVLIATLVFANITYAGVVNYSVGSGWQVFSYTGGIPGGKTISPFAYDDSNDTIVANPGTMNWLFHPYDYNRSDDDYRFTLPTVGTLIVVDLGWPSEAFEIFDNGSYTGHKLNASDQFPLPFYNYNLNEPTGSYRYEEFGFGAGEHEIGFYLQQWRADRVDAFSEYEAQLLGAFQVISSPLAGDLNADGFVGTVDLNVVLGRWNQSVTASIWPLGDPSGDGFVGIEDLNFVLGNWNAGTPPTTAVPEPATLWLMALVGICARRRVTARGNPALQCGRIQ